MTLTERGGLLILGGVLLAPLVTWLPMLAVRAPWLGLPLYPPAQGIDLWHLHTFWLVAFGLVAFVVAQHDDLWLACAVWMLGAMTFLRGVDSFHGIAFALGAVALLVARAIPLAWHARIRVALVVAGAFQAVYMLQQKYLAYDVLWGPLLGGTLVAHPQPLGTIGTVDAASAYVAVTTALMPPWLMPLGAAAVLSGRSYGALLALTAGLVWRYRRSWPGLAIALGAALAAAYIGAWKGYGSVIGRLQIWAFGLADLVKWSIADVVLGHGIGGWSRRIPEAQMSIKFLPLGNEVWQEAHNEYLQWAYETGAVGVTLALGWLRAHARMFVAPVWGPALVALAVTCVSFFSFHVVSLALLGVLLVGLASPRTHTQASSLGGSRCCVL